MFETKPSYHILQKWQKEWGDKTQAVFNSNAEVAKRADAGTAVLLNNPLLKFGTVSRPGLTLKQTKHVRRASRPRGTTHRVRKSKTYRKKNCIKRM